MAHGIAVPGRGHLRRMRLVQAHVADLMIVAIKDGDLVRLLQQLRWAIRKNERHPCRPTLVARVRIAYAIEPEFTVPFHDLHRLRFQDRIGVVAGKLEDVAGAVQPARPVDQRGGPDDSGSNPGSGCIQSPEKSGMDSALSL